MYLERDINLIAKYFLNELTPEDQVKLDEWLLHKENKDFFEAVSEEGFLEKELATLDYYENRVEKNNELVWNKIREDHKPVKVRKLWPSLLIAGCLIFIISGVYVWYNLNKRNNTVPNNITAVQNDIQPGKYKATLELADGSRIDLDSAGHGQIAQQGGTVIVNKTDGQLVYNITKQSSTEANILYNTLKTEKGQTYSVTLPDGSRVWLNAASSIKYPVAFNNKERRVTIIGEAYFEVEKLALNKGERVPFIVKVEDSAGNTNEEVEVLGTQFNINAYTEERNITTSLLEGRVRIERDYNIILEKPNQQGVLSKGTGNLAIVNNTNTEKAVAWKNGYFFFERDSLATVVKQIARWYNVDFVIDKRLSDKTFSGRIMRDMPFQKILEKLEMTSGVQFTVYEGKRFLISPKP